MVETGICHLPASHRLLWWLHGAVRPHTDKPFAYMTFAGMPLCCQCPDAPHASLHTWLQDACGPCRLPEGLLRACPARHSALWQARQASVGHLAQPGPHRPDQQQHEGELAPSTDSPTSLQCLLSTPKAIALGEHIMSSAMYSTVQGTTWCGWAGVQVIRVVLALAACVASSPSAPAGDAPLSPLLLPSCRTPVTSTSPLTRRAPTWGSRPSAWWWLCTTRAAGGGCPPACRRPSGCWPTTTCPRGPPTSCSMRRYREWLIWQEGSGCTFVLGAALERCRGPCRMGGAVQEGAKAPSACLLAEPDLSSRASLGADLAPRSVDHVRHCQSRC